MSTTALAVTRRLTKRAVTPQSIHFIIMLGIHTFLSKKIRAILYPIHTQKSMFSAVPGTYAASDFDSAVAGPNLLSGDFPQQAMLQ
jgi:hypothetical protein